MPAGPRCDHTTVTNVIEKAEVFAAINDYLDGGAGAPTRADVFRLIDLYLGD